MKTAKYTILVISIILLQHLSIFAQSSLKQEIIDFMKDYEKYSSFTKDGLSYEASYENEFRNLFRNREISENTSKYQVFNDVKNLNETSYLKVKDYVNMLRENFNKGINVTINIKDIGDPKKYNSNYSEVEVLVSKKLFGLGATEDIYKEDFDLVFLFRYKLTDPISDLKIISITAKGYPRTPSGLYIGINIQPSSTKITTSDFLNENSDYGTWTENGKSSLSFGLEVDYYFDKIPYLGIGARINYSGYKSDIKLTSIIQEPINHIQDIDGDDYSLLSEGKTFTEEVKLNFLEIPVYAKLRIVLDESNIFNHIYMNVGSVFSFGLSKSLITSGLYTYRGYYPEYHVVLHDIPEYGFYTDKAFDGTTDSNIKSFNVSGLVELGLNFPLIGDKLNMNFSILYQKSFLNLSAGNNNYLFSSGYSMNSSILDSRTKVSTGLFGLNIGILYKLF